MIEGKKFISRSIRNVEKSLTKNKKLIGLSIMIYLVGGAWGLFIGITVDHSQLELLTNSSPATSEFQGPASAFELLKMNLAVTLVLLGGTVTFGALSLLFLFVNGLFHFYTISLVPIGPLETMILLIPHGVFEIPGLWLASAVGFRIPHMFIRYMQGKREDFIKKEDLLEMGYLSIISILLILASVLVEAYITPKLATIV